MAGLYLMSGIGGNLFAAAVSYNGPPAVGASTADMGILPGFFALIILNWSMFDGNQ
jgi:membrane associated rhomboid family serine protease